MEVTWSFANHLLPVHSHACSVELEQDLGWIFLKNSPNDSEV
jgi:hypothetical protein